MSWSGSGRGGGIDAAVKDALNRFVRALDHAYGGRIEKVVVFGSRARGDHTADSDVDVAVVLSSLDGRRFEERMRMTDLGYEILVDTGLSIQAWPVTWSEWNGTAVHPNADFLANMKRDAVELDARAGRHGQHQASEIIRQRAARADIPVVLELLANAPDVPPDDGDEMPEEGSAGGPFS